MKFGRFTSWYDDVALNMNSKVMANIGDNVQTYAIDYLYKYMGIPQKDIIDINYTGLSDYKGDYVIVPMAQALSNYKRYNVFPLSEKIIPFFISTAQCDEECDEILHLFQQYQPIGCRDEVTMRLMRKKGIQAYLSGCITLVLPLRDNRIKRNKVFFVDTPYELEKYIPNNIKKNSVYVTHAYEYHKLPVDDKERKRLDNIAREQYRQYYEEAALVVSSRLHALAPCLAMGIPVIAVSHNFDYRFSWLDKFINLYYEKDFANIDWNPQVVNIEQHKQKLIKIFSDGILSLKNKYEEIYGLSGELEERGEFECNYVLKEKILSLSNLFNNKPGFRYAVWGCGVHGKLAYRMMQEYFPEAVMKGFIDLYVEGCCLGKVVAKPERKFFEDIDYIWITTHPGREDAKRILDSMNKKESIDYGWFMSLNR